MYRCELLKLPKHIAKLSVLIWDCSRRPLSNPHSPSRRDVVCRRIGMWEWCCSYIPLFSPSCHSPLAAVSNKCSNLSNSEILSVDIQRIISRVSFEVIESQRSKVNCENSTSCSSRRAFSMTPFPSKPWLPRTRGSWWDPPIMCCQLSEISPLSSWWSQRVGPSCGLTYG